jgi:hypothetical protein
MNRKITEQRGKCGICEGAFTNYSDIVPDHIPEVWEDHGETIILRISRLSTGGAMERKGQAGYRKVIWPKQAQTHAAY